MGRGRAAGVPSAVAAPTGPNEAVYSDLPVSIAQPNDLEPRRRHRRASDQLRELLA